MKDAKIGCALIVEKDKLLGLITESDFMELVIKALESDLPRPEAYRSEQRMAN